MRVSRSTGVEQCHIEVTVTEEPVSVVSEPSSVMEVEAAEPAIMSGCELPPVTKSTNGAFLSAMYL